jgi:LPS sulfotransferase NodH
MPLAPARWTAPCATYVIATNPRSGSWLLSEGLASTTVAGNPREWFNVIEEQQHRARWRMEHSNDLSYRSYLSQARAESTTPNGISGIKLHYYQLAELPKRIAGAGGPTGLTPTQLLPRFIPNAKYVWLRRADKTRQAISFVLALNTREWWKLEGDSTAKPAGGTDDPVYDGQALARAERMLRENDAKWQSFFEANGISPLVVEYDELVADYGGTIEGILRWLEIPDAASIVVPPPRLQRQSTARNDEWLARYTAAKGAGDDQADTGPLFNQIATIWTRIPRVWKVWIGRQKLLGATDQAIADVLVTNGYDRTAAVGAVADADRDPFLIGAARATRRAHKATSLLNAIGTAAALDQRRSVDRATNLSRADFRDRYYAANRPVVLAGLISHWPAIAAWMPAELKRKAGEQTVEAMTHRNADPAYEMNGRKHRTELRFADFVDMVYGAGVTNDVYLVANNAFFERPAGEALLADISGIPEYLNPLTDRRRYHLWFGPAGTTTPLHHDTSNILLAQVVGRKHYRLVPAAQWEYVYNTRGVFSDVDCERPDLERYPLFRNATVIDVTVEPGDVLFMPVGWWHHVRALDVSMTVSFTDFVFPNTFHWEHAR